MEENKELNAEAAAEEVQEKKPQKIKKPEREGTLGMSIVVFLLTAAILMFGILGLGLSAHVPLIAAVIIVTLYGRLVLHISLVDLEKSMLKAMGDIPFLILLSIGILIASWVASGTIPYLVYLGLKLISPTWFLAFVVLICAILSTATGSSWTTCGTLGVAFIGIAMGLGIPLGMTVGAIVCGAFFGDKQSPISDYAVFAAGVSKTNIYRHCHYMLYTSGPALLVSFVIFLVMGFQFSGHTTDMSQIQAIIDGLASTFNFNISMLIPLVVLAITIVMKMPATHSLILSAVSAILVAIFAQGASLGGVLGCLYGGFSIESGSAVVDSICNRGGMTSMVYNMTMLICSLSFGAVLGRTKVLVIMVNRIANIIRSRFSLIVSTFASSTVMSFMTGDPFIGGVIPSNALGDKYEELDVDRAVLSRTISDAACVQQPIVPWGVSGVFVVQCFGVPMSQFFMYYFMGFLTPLFGLITALTGIGCPKSQINAEKKAAEAEAK